MQTHALAVATLAAVLAGCASPAGSSDPSGRDAGVVTVGGRAGPLTPAVVAGLDATIGVEATDEADGLARLCRGEVDVVDTGRPADAAEVEACRGAGLDVVTLTVGAGADVLAVGPLTTAPECLPADRAQVPLDLPTTWSRLDPDLPDTPVDVVASRDLLTGAADVDLARRLPDLGATLLDLEEQVRAGWVEWAAADRAVRDARRGRAGRDAVAQAVSARGEVRAGVDALRARRDEVEAALADATAAGGRLAPTVGRLGVLGVGGLGAAEDGVRLLAVDGGAGCVVPDEASVLDGRYPLARPALLVTTTRALARPAVRSVLAGYLQRVPGLAAEHDLLPLPADRLDEQLAALETATPPSDVPPAEVERPVW